MLRISRRLRSLLFTAAATGACLAVPGSALAVPDWSTSTLTSSGPYTSGATASYVLELKNSGNALDPTAGSVQLSDTMGTATVVGTPTVAACATGIDQKDKVTVASGSATVTVLDGFGAGCAQVTLSIQLPSWYESSFVVQAAGTAGGETIDAEDSPRVVSKGGPSELRFTYSEAVPSEGLAGKWVKLNGSFTTNVTVKNHGTGAAHFVIFGSSAWGDASILSPTHAPNPAFNPTATVLANSACAPLSGGRCDAGTIAPGASITFPLQVASLTHLGSVGASAYVQQKADGADDCDTGCWDTPWLQVTDGRLNEVHVAIDDAPVSAAGNTDVVFNGEFVNTGPDAITNGALQVSATSFNAAGDASHSWDDTGKIQSIQRITLSNGAVCANQLNHAVTPAVARVDQWVCPVAELASGARVTFQVVARFATAKQDKWASVDASLVTPGYNPPASDTGSSRTVTLNPEKVSDLEVAVSSGALVGADRLDVQTVTVTNRGTAKAENATVIGALRGAASGVYEASVLPGNCTGVTKPQFTSCSLGDIEPGASKTLVLSVRAGATLGALAATYETDSWTLDSNPDNNTVTHVTGVVKAAQVPLNAVVPKPAKVVAAAVALRSGIRTKVNCPTTCKVTVKLTVPSSVLRTGRAGAKPVVIGSATKSSNAQGKVVVVTKIARKYAKVLRAYRKPLVVTRQTTAVSTAAANRGATTLTTHTFTIKSAKRR